MSKLAFLISAALPLASPTWASPASLQGACGRPIPDTICLPGGGADDTVPPASAPRTSDLPRKAGPMVRPGAGPESPDREPGSGPGPAGPPPASPGPGAGPPVGTLDPLQWNLWWRLERDGFLDLRDTVRRRHTMVTTGLSAVVRADLPPSRLTIDQTVLPALLHVLESGESDDMVTSALVAIARIGSTLPGPGAVPVAEIERALTDHLASPSQEVAETAALALGIFGEGTSFETLGELLGNTRRGAALAGRGDVPERMQAFAAFGLGVLAFDSQDMARRQEVAAVLLDTLEAPASGAEVPVAAMLALGQCQLSASVLLPPAALRSHPNVDSLTSSAGMAQWLLARLGENDRDSTVSSPKERAFCLATLAHFVMDRDDALRNEVLTKLRDEASNRRRPSEVRSAAVVALGELARSGKGVEDRASIRFLERLMDSGQPLERRFAAMALAHASARAGFGDDPFASAEPVAKSLRQQSLRGGTGERPWAALALGVQAYYRHEASSGVPAAPASAKTLQLRKEMLGELAKERNATSIGAYALGVALLHRGADPAARAKAGGITLDAFRRIQEPDARGYLAMALGLLGHEPAKDSLLESLQGVLSQPDLCWHIAVGLGLIGDVRLTPTLVEALIAAESHGPRAAIAVSLGSIGDRRAVEPLLALVGDRSMPSATRSMAIVGIGVLCEERSLPWRNPMAHALPYSAMTATLGGQGHAVFDIL